MNGAQGFALAVALVLVLALGAVLLVEPLREEATDLVVGEKFIEPEELEDEIDATLERRLGGFEPAGLSVECERIAIDTGEIGDCSVTDSFGDRVRVRVTVEDNEGHYRYEVFEQSISESIPECQFGTPGCD